MILRLRPAAAAWLIRHRGLAAAAALALGALLLLGPAARLGAPVAAGLLALSLAAALWLARDQWLRLRLSGSGGAGVVSVAEGQVRYFGPVTGGIVDLDTVVSIEMAVRPEGVVWVLREAGDAPSLAIPLSAEGAASLPDAFAALPGFSQARAASAAGGSAHAVIWRRAGAAPRLTAP